MSHQLPNITNSHLYLVVTLALLTLILVLAPGAVAQDGTPQPDDEQGNLQPLDNEDDSIAITLQDLVVIGTRVRGVAPENLSVPVDFYEIQEMTTTGTSDLGVALQQVAPSFITRNAMPLATAACFTARCCVE